MPSDLWNTALALYARPGVESACLQLQAAGGNVCLLLCACWLEQRGTAYTAQRLRLLKELADPWHEKVIQPLRQLRTQWREPAHTDAHLSALREQVKNLELEAEQQLLIRLENAAQGWPHAQSSDSTQWLEGLAAGAANLNRDALNQLRVAVTGA